MGAGLQSDKSGRSGYRQAAGLGCVQRHDFGVGGAGALGLALAEDLAVGRHQHAADRRVWRADQPRLASQLKGIFDHRVSRRGGAIGE